MYEWLEVGDRFVGLLGMVIGYIMLMVSVGSWCHNHDVSKKIRRRVYIGTTLAVVLFIGITAGATVYA